MASSEEALGMVSALGSLLFFGSFAVPMKMSIVLAARVDPVIYQSYKSLACFTTSWLVLLYSPFRFTWWGMAGALVWVITGIMAVNAVQWAGIGLAQSLWSGLSIFVSYFWGAYVFKEPIKDHVWCIVSLFIMGAGMVGIGVSVSGNGTKLQIGDKLIKTSKHNCGDYIALNDNINDNKEICNNSLIKGTCCAALVGLLNGSFMIPLKYANMEVVGIEYVLSFGIGALAMTSLVLAIYSSIKVCTGHACPSFKVREAAGPALLTGLLWSAGNFLSIYTTLYLGVALGWPLVQCQLLVSALWAAFYYKEADSGYRVVILIASSFIVVIGALMLSYFGTVG